MKKIISVLFSALAYAGSVSAQTPDVINFYMTPSVSIEKLKGSAGYIKDFLEKETGIKISVNIPASYDELVERFGTPSPCFAMMSSQSYVMANKKYGALVKLRTVRYGHSVYYGMIITSVASGIKKLSDLNGKTIAYTDELSTSGYLYPKKLLESNGVKPSKEIFVQKHDEVVKLVYQGKVDAGAAFYSPPSAKGEIRDARSKIKDKFPDVDKKVNVLKITDPIPNDPIVFSKNFNSEMVNKLYYALIKLSTDAKGKQILLDLYGTEGFARASDTDYNTLRSVMASK